MGRRKGTYNQGLRLVELYDALMSGSRVRAAEWAEKFETSRRTVERDVALLRDLLGDRLETVPGHDGRVHYYLPSRQRRQDVQRWQVLAIGVGARLAGFLEGERFRTGIQGLLEQLRMALPQRTRDDVDLLKRKIHVVKTGQKRYDQNQALQQVLAAMLDGLLLDQQVELAYLSHTRALAGGEPRRLVVEPLCLVLHRYSVYFIVRVAGGRWRRPRRILLALDRIQQTTLTDTRFRPPKGFFPDRFLKDAFGIFAKGEAREVVLRVDAEMAPYVKERHWHPSGGAKDLPDGGLEYRLRVAGDEVLEWVLALGHHVEVLAPADLRSEVRRRLEAALGRYQ